MIIRKRKIVKPTPTPKKERAYVHVYRVGDDGLKDHSNHSHHKGPSPITMLHVYDFGGIDPSGDGLEHLYEALAMRHYIVKFPGRYFTLSTDTRLTTNFVVHEDGSITRGFAYGA